MKGSFCWYSQSVFMQASNLLLIFLLISEILMAIISIDINSHLEQFLFCFRKVELNVNVQFLPSIAMETDLHNGLH